MSEILQEGGRRTRGVPDKLVSGYPLVSVITSVYNGAAGIERTINSVVTQDYPCLEYIVVDGGSTDGTVEILRQRDDVIDYWVSAHDEGIYDAWNKGVKAAHGEWIAFLGVGDVYLPRAISKYMDFARQHPGYSYISSRVHLMREGKRVRTIGRPWSWPAFQRYMTVAHVGSLHSKALYALYGVYDQTYHITGDYELLLRPGKDLKALYIPEPTAEMDLGGASNGSTKVFKEALRAKVQTGKRNAVLAGIDDFIARVKFYIRLYLLS